jgi:hypothetical protein
VIRWCRKALATSRQVVPLSMTTDSPSAISHAASAAIRCLASMPSPLPQGAGRALAAQQQAPGPQAGALSSMRVGGAS